MTRPENFGPQFTCEHCGQPLNDHPADEFGKHGAISIFEEVAAKFNTQVEPVKIDGEFKYPDGHGPSLHPDLIASMGNVEANRKVDLSNRKDLVNHLESPHGHNLIDDVGYGSLEYRDAYDHYPEKIPGVDFTSGPEKLSLKELQALHMWFHDGPDGVKHLTKGNEHYHV